MDIDQDFVPIQRPQQTVATILCYNCGAAIDGTNATGALCEDCFKLSVDITEGIQREATLHFCKDCDRWLSPPNQWLVAQPESPQLLAICLRRLTGLHKVRMTDARFIWTEPHSRRLRVKITVQQSASQLERYGEQGGDVNMGNGGHGGAIVQQTFEVVYVLATQQCPDCAKSYTHNTWRASVQVRQKVPHKRTFLYLEQLILKHGAHKDTVNIKEESDGIDFYFAQRNHAEGFVDFLTSVVPCQVKKSSRLISANVHTSIKSYKFSYSVDIVPICKDDLVALPIKLANSIGQISPLTLCYRVGNALNLLDPNTLQTAEVSCKEYWHAPFTSMADVKELTEFVVLDIEGLGVSKGRFFLAEATVARASDFGVNDKSYLVRTHLGGILHPGDSVLGYHLSGTNFNNENFEAIERNHRYGSTIPDVILVKKHYARRPKARARNWKLKRMAREEGEMSTRKQDQDRMDRDYEMFLRDVEEDEELQQTIAMYRAQKRAATGADDMEDVDGEGDDELEEGPRIRMDRLLDDFEDMKIEEG